MAARKTASKGNKPDKLMRDALILELSQEEDDGKGGRIKGFRSVARALVNAGKAGDMQAIKEIDDRVDGRAPQSVQMDVDGTFTIEVVQFGKKK